MNARSHYPDEFFAAAIDLHSMIAFADSTKSGDIAGTLKYISDDCSEF